MFAVADNWQCYEIESCISIFGSGGLLLGWGAAILYQFYTTSWTPEEKFDGPGKYYDLNWINGWRPPSY